MAFGDTFVIIGGHSDERTLGGYLPEIFVYDQSRQEFVLREERLVMGRLDFAAFLVPASTELFLFVFFSPQT